MAGHSNSSAIASNLDRFSTPGNRKSCPEP
jgi:hypothetical protein